jgi:hypothetical protein
VYICMYACYMYVFTRIIHGNERLDYVCSLYVCMYAYMHACIHTYIHIPDLEIMREERDEALLTHGDGGGVDADSLQQVVRQVQQAAATDRLALQQALATVETLKVDGYGMCVCIYVCYLLCVCVGVCGFAVISVYIHLTSFKQTCIHT